MSIPELLAPAGNLEKLKTAIRYGADAVYIGGENYGLRDKAQNFTLEEMKKAVEFVHSRDKKLYVTVNIIPHNSDLEGLPGYIEKLNNLSIDGVIIADPGVQAIVKEKAPGLKIHLSTQANTTNWRSALFWQQQGVERVILARELSLAEIKEIKKKTDLELEIFVHGAMCISYSGRCLLSNYMTNRDSNRGRCAHSCRWQYALVEKERPNEYYPIAEDEQGSYIFNSKDLCLIEHIPKIVDTGVDSLKIEGRMKSLHYVATVTNVYRQALDEYIKDPADYKFKKEWFAELKKISHRQYTTGFYYDPPEAKDHNYESSGYSRNFDFMGVVKDYFPNQKEAQIEVRNKFFQEDVVEFFGPGRNSFSQKIDYIKDEKGIFIEEAPHPKQLITVPVNKEVEAGYLVRRERGEKDG